jgi:2-amino-4-hydroxy-6-hydroxymethyldihydropteridine diphosphokinase
MADIYLALGSNLDDSKANINTAMELLNQYIENIVRAPFYTSKAIGYTRQPDFINTAIKGSTVLEPLELLKCIKLVEKKVGRIDRFRWGPREIDIDIIFYDNIVINSESLTIPHPQYLKRDFVLKPISDIAPDLIDPISRKPIISILNKLDPSLKSNLRKVDV